MRDMFLFLYILGTYQISQIYQIYQIDQGRFFYIIVFSDISGMYQITCGGPDPVGGLGGGGWGACWPPRNAWSLDTCANVDAGAGAGGILCCLKKSQAYHGAIRGPSEPQRGWVASSSEVKWSRILWRKNPWPKLMGYSVRGPCGHLILILVLTSSGLWLVNLHPRLTKDKRHFRK